MCVFVCVAVLKCWQKQRLLLTQRTPEESSLEMTKCPVEIAVAYRVQHILPGWSNNSQFLVVPPGKKLSLLLAHLSTRAHRYFTVRAHRAFTWRHFPYH